MGAVTPISRDSASLAGNARRQYLLLEFVSYLVGVRDLDAEWPQIIDRLKWLLDFHRLDLASVPNAKGEVQSTTLFKIPASGGADLAWAFQRLANSPSQMLVINSSEFEITQTGGLKSILLIKLGSRNQLPGALCFGSKAAEAYEAEDQDVAHNVAIHLATVRERAATQLVLRESHEQLVKAVDDLKTFSHSVAHDLRAPIRAVRSFAQLLLEDHGAELKEGGISYVKRIDDAASKMDSLVRALLNYAELGYSLVPVESVAIEEIFNQVTSAWTEPSSPVAPRFKFRIDAPRVLANRTLLVQVLGNLLSNAVKFVRYGTVPHIVFHAESRGPKTRIWVRDNGIGIDQKHHAQIFDVFQRLHAANIYPGSGVGLAIVRRACERMGGTVGLESALGIGSSFWVEFETPGK